MLSNLTVAIALYVCVMMAGPLSGGGINPTIAIAIITTDTLTQTNNEGHALFLIPYILGPLIGCIASAGLNKLSQKITLDGEENDSFEEVEQAKGDASLKEDEDSMDFDNRRNSARGLTIQLDDAQKRKGSSIKRKSTGLDRRSARDYMA